MAAFQGQVSFKLTKSRTKIINYMWNYKLTLANPDYPGSNPVFEIR
jgi:hypothetical protein